MKKEKILVVAIAGAGKTYLAEHYENVVDFEYLYHLWNYDEAIKDLPIDQHKGNPNRKPNPDYPWNYIVDIKHELEKGKIVVIPGMPNGIYACIVGKDYFDKDTRIIFALPDKNDFETLAERFRKRGNPESFVNLVKDNFLKAHDLAQNFEGAEYLVIPPKKYLSDALIEYGIKLKPGIGLIKENRNAGKQFEKEYKKLKNQKKKYSVDITTSTIKEL